MQENQFDISGLIRPLNFGALLMLHGVHYKPGTSIPVADALSRAPLNYNNDEDHETISNLTYNAVKEKQMNEIKEASKDDEEMNMLMQNDNIWLARTQR